MRKDYITTEHDDSTDEATFIEDFWTNVWDDMGGPQAKTVDIEKKNEYRVIAPYIARLPKGAHILDGGCGLGEWTVYFAKHGFHSDGLDLSHKTIQKLHDIFPDVTFSAGDIRHTEYADNALDCYFSWGVFEHFEEGMAPCIKEAYRILKPGGYLFISVPFDNIRQSLRASIDRHKRTPPFTQERRFYQWRFTREELRSELNAQGFDVHEVSTIHKRQGVLRSLHHEFKLNYDWFFTKGLSVILSPIIPGALVAHMILAVAQKPFTSVENKT